MANNFGAFYWPFEKCAPGQYPCSTVIGIFNLHEPGSRKALISCKYLCIFICLLSHIKKKGP